MSETPDEYNIRAVTKNFGYFGWNIKASCFYAVNNTEKAPCREEEGDPNDDIKYIVRSIDLDDVFPKTSGESLTNPQAEVGRTPGFNWSSKAFNNKNILLLSPGYTAMHELDKIMDYCLESKKNKESKVSNFSSNVLKQFQQIQILQFALGINLMI